MRDKDAKIFVVSMKNISKELKHYGNSDINNINLLKLIYKYSKHFTKYQCLKSVDKMVNYLQRSDRRICMETTYTKGYSYEYNTVDVSNSSQTNIAPTLSDNSKTVSGTSLFTIRYNDLYAGYFDFDGDLPGSITIKTVPANGTLTIDGVEVSPGQTIAHNESLKIEFERDSDLAYSTFFTYSIYDTDDQVPLESNTATFSLNVLEVVPENEPPTIGDLTMYTDNRSWLVITVDNILNNSSPSYSDPEGNQLDAIRIDSIASSNVGKYYYYGSEIQVGAIITYDDLVAGAFTYTAADINLIQTDVIEVSIRDNVNMEWVSS